MSTFQSFQTGLMAGQQQAKTRREDDARKKASEAFSAGDYGGASQSLMGVGLTDEANTYGKMGDDQRTRKRTEAYAGAMGSSTDPRTGYQAVRQAAAGQGDIATMTQIDQTIAGLDETQRKHFSEGMEFLGSTAMNLKTVPPEQRGQAAMEILQKTPYANTQVMAQIQQAAADGKITDEELDAFAQQTLSVAERVKAKMEADKPYTLGPGQVRYGPDGKELARGPAKTTSNGIQLEFGEDGSVSGLSIGGTGTKGNEPAIVRGPNGQPLVSPGAQQLKSNKAWNSLQDFEVQNRLVLEDVGRALKNSSAWTTGFMGALTNGLPGTPAYDLAQTVKTIGANVAFDKLSEMRANSPTGGALGSVSDQENALLRSVLGSLEQAQSQEQFEFYLTRLQDILTDKNGRRRDAFTQDYPELAQFAGFGNQVTTEIKRLNSDPNKAAAEYQQLPSGAFYINPDTGKKQQKK